MPQDLPGFYYDAEKNRYFPIKGPIPGSSHRNNGSSSSLSTAKKSATELSQESNVHRRLGTKTAKLLQVRELYGNVITSRKGKFNFQEEYQKTRASKPMIWKYHGTERIGDGALEQTRVDIERSDGAIGTDILLTGGVNGSLCLYEVCKVERRQFNHGLKCIPERVLPLSVEKQAGFIKLPGHLWRPSRASALMSSNISCIQVCRADNAMQHVLYPKHLLLLITSIGSETSGGSVYVLNLNEPLEYNLSLPLTRRLYEITSFDCTVWTADCNSDGIHAVIGTNLGASLVNLETGAPSWVLRCKSDVLSLQHDQSGNNVICGLRNGAIVTVDIRQRPEEFSARLSRHRIPYPSRNTSESSSRSGQKYSKKWFELKGNISHSNTIYMPSSISCLASLELYDQYFLASSMDGSIKLYDQRLIQRGAVQSYEGNVNSHTRVQLGVDPSERFVMSGGEDCYLRLWSIKSGELLFEDKFMNSVPSVVCWSQSEGNQDGAWLGSHEGLFYTRWL
ncbi:hypothetical protein LguiB_033740 [Lonicera macranthoides]